MLDTVQKQILLYIIKDTKINQSYNIAYQKKKKIVSFYYLDVELN